MHYIVIILIVSNAILLLLFTIFLGLYLSNKNINKKTNINKNINMKNIIATNINDKKHIGNAYNLGDIMKAPRFWGHEKTYSLKLFPDPVLYYPGSIGWYFWVDTSAINWKRNKETVNSLEMRAALDKFNRYRIIGENKYNILSQQDTTIVIHLRSGDKGSNMPNYINALKMISNKFKDFLVCSGIHYKSETANENLNNSINQLLQVIPNALFIPGSPDEHIALMAESKNLLLHRGGFSILAAILSNQNTNLYYTADFEPTNYNTLTWQDMMVEIKWDTRAILLQ